jgi:hypothetical protein
MFSKREPDGPSKLKPEVPPWDTPAERAPWDTPSKALDFSGKAVADDTFIGGLTDPQQYVEGVKGVVPGAVQFGGTVLKGTEATAAQGQHNAAAFGAKQLAIFDRIDRGETVPETDDPMGYQHMGAGRPRGCAQAGHGRAGVLQTDAAEGAAALSGRRGGIRVRQEADAGGARLRGVGRPPGRRRLWLHGRRPAVRVPRAASGRLGVRLGRRW